MGTPRQPGGRARVKNALGGDSGGIGRAWNRVPRRVRAFLPLIVVVLVAVVYPSVVDSLRGLAVIGDFFPQLSSMVIILVFTMMAVGLNIVVGYAGLLDLGYVAFYAAGAYVAGWFASGQFEQVSFHLGSVGIDRNATGIHVSLWLVFIMAGIGVHDDRNRCSTSVGRSVHVAPE